MGLIRAPQAWDASRGQAAKVAVIDSGIDVDHPDLAGHVALAETFIGGGTADTLGHGTAVAGIIAATANNHVGITGVAPNVKLYSLKVLADDGSTTEDVLSEPSTAPCSSTSTSSTCRSAATATPPTSSSP